MKETSPLIKSALASAVAKVVADLRQSSNAEGASRPTATTEKSYGVNEAYKNKGAAPDNSCAGQNVKPRDPNAVLALPDGLCKKIHSVNSGTRRKN